MSCRNLLRACLWLALATAAAGCFQNFVYVRHVLTGPARAERTELSKIQVFKAGESLPQAYDEIAILQVEGMGENGVEAGLIEALKQRVQELGGNGLIEVRKGDGIGAATGAAVYFHAPSN